jgi:tetratricopeptide (TPR) repeat protein
MRIPPLPRASLAFALALLLPAAPLRAQQQRDPYAPGGGPDGPWAPKGQEMLGGPPPPGIDREKMWPAPTAEDWKKPCLIHWQRTWDDAVAVSKATGKPIMVCVNMDGEVASEHYAGVRYRDPESARLYEPYVCVIASVYRHNPRDYDEQGRRIPCPRFGTVTCGEHIAIETVLYQKYFKGQRVAPRHIGVDLAEGGPDGKEAFDIYYAWDTKTIFDNLKAEADQHGPPLAAETHGDRPVLERVASRDARDRNAVEKAYADGDSDLRRQLITQALDHPDAAPVDLLREAVFGLDTDLSKLAREALAKSTAPEAIPVINEALAVPMAQPERASLVAALDRLGEQTPRARTLAVVQRGLSTRSDVIDVGAWREALAKAGPASDAASVEAELAKQDEIRKGSDPEAHLKLAEAYVAAALDPDQDARFARLLLMDAESTAQAAAKLSADPARVAAVLTVVSARQGSMDEARAHAADAIHGLPAEPQGREAALVLEQFSESRQRQIGKALRERRSWPPEWLSDVDAAYAVLAVHPFGTDEQVVARYDLLRWFGATVPADAALDAGLARFPGSAALNDRMRGRLLAETGADGLEGGYRRMMEAKGASPQVIWYAAYATLVAAEYDCRTGEDDSALSRYERGIALYEKAAAESPDDRSIAQHYIALAQAGRAHIANERGEDQQALDLMLDCFTRSPNSAATQDGLGITPVDTARMLLSRLKQEKKDELAAKLQSALDQLDPELLKLPGWENVGGTRRGVPPNTPPPQGGGR